MEIMGYLSDEDESVVSAVDSAFHACNELLRINELSFDETASVDVRLSLRTNTATIKILSDGNVVKEYSIDLPVTWLAEIIRKDTDGLTE